MKALDTFKHAFANLFNVETIDWNFDKEGMLNAIFVY